MKQVDRAVGGLNFILVSYTQWMELVSEGEFLLLNVRLLLKKGFDIYCVSGLVLAGQKNYLYENSRANSKGLKKITRFPAMHQMSTRRNFF